MKNIIRYMNFRTTTSVDHDVEMWFDHEFHRTGRVQSQPLGKWSVVLDGGQLTICENQCFPHAAGASDKVRMHVGSPHRSRQATCPVGSAPAAELDR
jgi:hypothetical protein